MVILALALSVLAPIRYVDASAPGGDGSSWSSAMNDLQAAIDTAPEGTEIRVAAGTYKSHALDQSFSIPSGMTLIGGFGDESILSGDILGDDGPYFLNHADNCYHVVTMTESDATIDGFTIYGGMAGSDAGGMGGGMEIRFSQPTIRDCTFVGNWAIMGGAIRFDRSQALIEHCRFVDNSAFSTGGDIHNFAGALTIRFTAFSGSYAENGGSMFIHYGTHDLWRRGFDACEADIGAAIRTLRLSSTFNPARSLDARPRAQASSRPTWVLWSMC